MPVSTRRLGVSLSTAVVLLVVATLASAQQRRLSLEEIYGPDKLVNFGGTPSPNLAWIDATHYAWPRTADGGSVDWLNVDAPSGASRPLFDTAKLVAALGRLPAVSADEARRLARSPALSFNSRYSALLLTIADDLYYYPFDGDRATRLTYRDGAEENASFSPDGSLVAFVRRNNLFVVDVQGQRETPLTTDGTAKILNGKLDWVYEEEVFGRGAKRSYWWSPDSSRIAFLQIDDTQVPEYAVVDHIPYDPTIERWDYPKAGDPNPLAKLGVVRVNAGAPAWIDTQKYSGGEHLIVAVSWTPDGRQIAFAVQNRTQTWLDLNVAEAASGSIRTMLRDNGQPWVNLDDRCTDPTCGTDDPIWLQDGSFVKLSSRSGWPHLCHYDADGSMLGQITNGMWEVRTVHGVDEAGGWIYFSGTERSAIGLDVYRIRLDGSGLQRLSKTDGTHVATFSPDFSKYIDSWSDVVTPTQVRLVRADGTDLRSIDENKVPVLAAYHLSKPEFLQVKTRDGFVMEAMLIKPPDFDPSRRYPVYQFTYGGPHTPLVRNAWGGTGYLYHQLLAQQGIIVWICDNRTASGKGARSAWPVYRRFGELELRDIEDGLNWLTAQPWVDASRIGIHGWSYGGYLTTYALTHSTSFAMGIAGGPVTDWRNYDSVYTERYMGLPQENPEGYRLSSPRWAAKDLRGALLLIHGAIDDNVHVQNTLQFAHELQKAQKPFQLMLYPSARHGISNPLQIAHLRKMMFDFVLQHLKPDEPGPATPADR